MGLGFGPLPPPHAAQIVASKRVTRSARRIFILNFLSAEFAVDPDPVWNPIVKR
ncbi:MAG: hypothetical protein AABM32_11925 [Chloroflexota bacterium]